ncbi:hypothetical protein VW35_14515 [Devosia soli]|uniref:DUF2134 domain-containing protein n=1 Tax=Devosia soli TaxID=361041 RepID=A0A0F5L616_9HYPH|nr:TadG family pilus assembly protein [Devosia soli]KKB77856.1 hypothetical protein VW35_14515 [Devosia soli]
MNLWRDESGNMAILFAVAFSLFGVIGAISIDVATLYHARRMLQSTVDLAAITAAAAPRDAVALARKVFLDAGYDISSGLVVEAGRYEGDKRRPPEDRFIPNGTPLNAVRVSFQHVGSYEFGRAFTTSAPVISAQGTASVTPEVQFSLGSRLASLNGGVVNGALGSLLGTTISLSALDYSGLASADVDVFRFLDALAQRLHVTAGSYDTLLRSEARAGDIAAALSSVATGAQKLLLDTVARAGPGNIVPLAKLFNLDRYARLGIGSGAAVLSLKTSALDILSAAAAVADGSKQVSLGLGGNLPGIAALTVELAIGEPAQGSGWLSIGHAGDVVRTSQARLRIDAQFLGGLVLQNALLRLPLWLDLANAEAVITAATCPDSANPHGTADIAVVPGPLTLAVGQVGNAQMRDFAAPLPLAPTRILDAVLLKISASGQVRVMQTTPIPLHFSSDNIGQARRKTARTSTMVTSLTQSLVNSLSLNISVLGLGIAPDTVLIQAVKTLISPLAVPLDAVVNALLSALGLGVGEADLRVYGVACKTPVLVG